MLKNEFQALIYDPSTLRCLSLTSLIPLITYHGTTCLTQVDIYMWSCILLVF